MKIRKKSKGIYIYINKLRTKNKELKDVVKKYEAKLNNCFCSIKK